MSIRSGDIGDQSRKLSEIAPKFGRLLPCQILGGKHCKDCTHISTPASWHVVWKSLVRILPLAPKFKLYGRTRWILGQILNFCHLGGSIICTSITFSFLDQSSPTISPNVSGVVVDQLLRPPIFDMSTHCGVQSRKSSKIAPSFGGFFAQILGGGPSKIVPTLWPCIATSRLEKFREDISTSPEIIGHTRWILSQILKFTIFWVGGPRLRWGLCWQSFVNI